jgi:hypothetical protein
VKLQLGKEKKMADSIEAGAEEYGCVMQAVLGSECITCDLTNCIILGINFFSLCA